MIHPARENAVSLLSDSTLQAKIFTIIALVSMIFHRKSVVLHCKGSKNFPPAAGDPVPGGWQNFEGGRTLRFPPKVAGGGDADQIHELDHPNIMQHRLRNAISDSI